MHENLLLMGVPRLTLLQIPQRGATLSVDRIKERQTACLTNGGYRAMAWNRFLCCMTLCRSATATRALGHTRPTC
jgi:hypothetical protein